MVVLVALLLVVIIGMAGLVIDVGNLHVVQNKLQTAADAAALAGAEQLSNGGAAAQTTAVAYSDNSGNAADQNLLAGFIVPAPTTQLECLSAATTGSPVSCSPNPSGQYGYDPNNACTAKCNGIRVTEQTTVNPWFMQVLGFGAQTVTATATGSETGGNQEPIDVQVIVDSTASMQDQDSCGGSVPDIPVTGGSPTQEDCAKAGVRELLSILNPCNALLTTCGTPVLGNVANPFDRVGLMTFPALVGSGTNSISPIPAETNCINDVSINGAKNVTYTDSPIYQIVPFSSDYRSSDTAGLNETNSELVDAVDWSDCPGGVYPVNKGNGTTTSIAGGGAGDITTASNNSAGIAGGPAIANDSNSSSTPAIVGGPSVPADFNSIASAGLGGGSTVTNDSSGVATGIGGGIAALDTNSIATGGRSPGSITIPAPQGVASGTFELVTITASALSTGAAICAPNSGWTQLSSTGAPGVVTSGTLTEASFYSITTPTSYKFSFQINSCGGSSSAASASAVVVVYTGVDLGAPLDGVTPTFTSNTTNTVTGPTITPLHAGDEIVTLFGANGAFNNTVPTLSVQGTSTSTGADEWYSPTIGASPANQTATTTTTGIVGMTVALKAALPSSIVVPRPSGWAASDLVLVSVAVRTLGAGVICAPTDATWTPVQVSGTTTPVYTMSVGSGATALTQETFWSESTPSADRSYTFSFASACGTGGSAVSAGASAIALVYTGASLTPIDVSKGASGTTGVTVKAPSVTTTLAGDQVVNLYATDAAALTGPAVSQPGDFTSVGSDDALQPTVGASGAATATSASANWTAETIALAAPLSSIVVPRPSGWAASDLVLVSVAVRTLGVGVICAPTDATWTPVQASGTTTPVYTETGGSGKNALTQETFWSETTSSADSSYTFSFASSCGTGGTPVEAGASALALVYTDASLTPIDVSKGASGGAALTVTAPSVTTTLPGDQVVNLYATAAGALTGPAASQPGDFTSVGSDDALQPAIGASGTDTATTASAAWTAETVAIATLLPSSVVVPRPLGWAANDLVLVSVAVRSLGSGVICAPTDSTWTPVQASGTTTPVYTVTAGAGTTALTQETFWSNTTLAADSAYTFSFASSCASGGSPTPVPAGASAIVLIYTGAGTVPIDVSKGVAATGAGTTLMAPSVTTTLPGDQVVNLYATDAAAVTGVAASQPGSWTSIGSEDAPQPAVGLSATASAISANALWTAETVAIGPPSPYSVTIQRPPSPASTDFLLVTVTAEGLPSGDVICAPQDTSEPWSPVQFGGTTANPIYAETSGSGATAVSQESFWSNRSTATAESYTFSFSTSCGGTLVAVAGSAIAVRYTGVNPLTPIDPSSTATLSAPGAAAGTTVTAPAASPSAIGEAVVSLYSTGAPAMSQVPANQYTSGSPPATGVETALYKGPALAAQTAQASTSTNFVGATISLQATNGGCYGDCTYGLEDPGGVSTYYADVLDAAQASFTSSGRPGVQDAIILLSDGDANTPVGPDPCQQGIAAAEQAEAAGTVVYTIAYGALNTATSNNCGYDLPSPNGHGGTNLTASTGIPVGLPAVNVEGLTPLCAMHLMADNAEDDSTFSSSGNTGAEQTLCTTAQSTDATHHFYVEATDSDLTQAFQSIATSLSAARLVSNNAQ